MEWRARFSATQCWVSDGYLISVHPDGKFCVRFRAEDGRMDPAHVEFDTLAEAKDWCEWAQEGKAGQYSYKDLMIDGVAIHKALMALQVLSDGDLEAIVTKYKRALGATLDATEMLCRRLRDIGVSS